MRVAITGGTGLIGAALADAHRARGDDVVIVTRKPREPGHIAWDPGRAWADVQRLDGLDVLYHLAGAPIADRPWTRQRRRVLWESRIDTAAMLREQLVRVRAPKVWVGVSVLGRFGDRGEEVLDDDASQGPGYLAELATAWEDAHLAAEKLGCRVAVLRMSVVLDARGGVFPLMIHPFRMGIGGWLGDGRQYTPWITGRDAVRALLHLADKPLTGGFNGTVPHPVRHYEWMKALANVLHSPVIAQAPRWALRGAFGELADDLLLSSVRAVPRKLSESGFVWLDPEAEPAFGRLVGELDARRRA